MRKALLVLITWMCVVYSNAQELSPGQLEKEIDTHTQEDTFRVNRLNKLSFSNSLGFKQRENLAVEALAISRKIGYAHGEGIALINLGYSRYRQGRKQEGDSLFRASEVFAKNQDDPELKGVLHYRQGLAIINTSGDKSSLDYLLKAEQDFEKSGSYNFLSECQEQIGIFYQQYVSNYPLAMEYYLKSIKTAEKFNLSSRYILGQADLGSIYSSIGDHNQALIELEKASIAQNKIPAGSTLNANIQNALGEEFRLSGRYPEALQAYRLAIENNPNKPDYVNESNLADTYSRMDSLQLAFEYAFKSLVISNQKENRIVSSWIQGVLARTYLKKNMPDSAIHYAHSGLSLANQLGSLEFMRDNTETLAKAYALKKDFSKAYAYHLQYINYRDSLLSDEIRNKTAVVQFNNDLEKKQAQIAQLNEQKKAQQYFLIGALIVLGLILLSAILLLRNNRQKQKAYNNVQLLAEVGHQISSSLSVDKIIATAYDNVNTLMDANVFGIGIYHELLGRIEFPSTYEKGRLLPFYTNDVGAENRLAPICFRTGKEIVIGDLNKEYQTYLQNIATPHEGEQPLSLIFLPLIVYGRKLGVITVQSFKRHAYTDYHLFMLRSIAVYAAIALDNAKSYEELNQAMANLKTTQAQLIQSEKMASLGELTAGIAHEIQNPLNFVNNFAEVNEELITEMDESLTAGNIEDARALAKNIRENDKKILFHGRRADIIVKGMLQHSRGNSGSKELTDINGLCDEYFRLSYHGLRAKDNQLNADIELNLDKEIPALQIVPQDIGRVLLNLYNNAFYAVQEKKKSAPDSFKPKVSVSTKKTDTGILIRVKDNGAGIPPKIADKIFQPFFTTKPAGQGTGLGLSLSYDIVKVHGGEILLNTNENEGTEFTISLPG